MLSNKWESFLYNDINELVTGLFIDAVYGKYHDESRVITRDEFEDLKDSDGFVKYIWSYGNAGEAYLWGKEIEEMKQAASHIILDSEIHDRRLAYMHFIKLLEKDDSFLKNTNTNKRLEQIEHLQALNQLEALQRLEVSNIDYKNYKYIDGDVVYCDVPYEKLGSESCDDYGVHFNSLEFYQWAKEQPYQVFFSSYEISDDSFEKIKIKDVMRLMGANSNDKKDTEYLYSNKPFNR